ncbi:hypothetical protein ANCDUO_14427, partial [Ancylostoma duodenale]
GKLRKCPSNMDEHTQKIHPHQARYGRVHVRMWQLSINPRVAGMLLGINAVYHIVCLVSELFNAAFLLSGEPIVRRVCYPYMVVYIYTICQQASMILMISLDLLISLLFPFW